MNFLNYVVHGAVGLGAMASVGLGGGVVAQHVQAHNDIEAKAHIEAKIDKEKGDKKEVKRPVTKPINITVAIGAKGRVAVHGATVTAVSGNTVTAKSSVNASSINWSVNTASAKVFAKGQRATTTLASVAVGDTVNFAGVLSSSASFVVDASVLHDLTR